MAAAIRNRAGQGAGHENQRIVAGQGIGFSGGLLPDDFGRQSGASQIFARHIGFDVNRLYGIGTQINQNQAR